MLKHNLLNLQELIQATTAKAFQIERHELEAQPAQLADRLLAAGQEVLRGQRPAQLALAGREERSP